MKAAFEKITPAYATTIMEQNVINRPLRPAYVKKLADEMKAGNWVDHHQAIGINCDGSVIDGQHRLQAIITSGTTQTFLVVREVPKKAIAVIDAHAHRSVKDGLKIVYNINATTRAVSCAMYIDARGSARHLLPAARIDQFKKYQRLIERAERIFDTNIPGVCRGNVLAVIARALATRTIEEIEPFCQLLITGESKRSRDRIGIKLRDFLMTKVAGQGGRGLSHAAAYRRTEFALDAWLNNRGDETLRDADTELFLLRGEKPDPVEEPKQ